MNNVRGPLDCLTERVWVEKICLYDLELLKERIANSLFDWIYFSLVLAPDGSSHSKVAILQEIPDDVKTDIS